MVEIYLKKSTFQPQKIKLFFTRHWEIIPGDVASYPRKMDASSRLLLKPKFVQFIIQTRTIKVLTSPIMIIYNFIVIIVNDNLRAERVRLKK